MLIRIATFTAVMTLTALAAQAQQKAGFIDGTYVLSVDGCNKLKALKRGVPESIGTVPWSVDADGISMWEGGCGWSKVQKLGGKRWALTAECEQEVDTSVETYEYTRTSPTTFAVKLTTKGTSKAEQKPVTYLKCDVK